MFDFLSFTLPDSLPESIFEYPHLLILSSLFLFFLDETAMTLEAYNSSQTNPFQREFNLESEYFLFNKSFLFDILSMT